MAYRWEVDDATAAIVASLQSTTTVETRVLLKPIFRWAKREPDKAYEYVLWLLELYTHGDPDRGINVQPTLQADYAINTLITASQRCGKAFEAERAFTFLPTHNFVPDVFAYTALIDVLGRCGQAEKALQRYDDMLRTPVQPNIVTFTTVLRVLAMSTSVDTSFALSVLDRAKRQNDCDPSLYTEALDMCAKRGDLSLATAILRRRRQDLDNGTLMELLVERTVHSLGRAMRKAESFDIVQKWLDEGLIHDGDRNALTYGRSDASNGREKSAGCLGYETPASVRQSVIQQDIYKLVERSIRGVMPTRMDFETLVHQCRKRKWKDEIDAVFQAMQLLGTNGWQSDDGAIDLPPQPNVLPTASTYLALIDAFICCNAPEHAWKTYMGMDAMAIPRTQAIVRKYIRGTYLAMKDDLTTSAPSVWHLSDVVRLAMRDGIPVTHRMAMYILRLYGNDEVAGLTMLSLLDQERSYTTSVKHHELTYRTLFDELIQACVYAHNASGAIVVWEAFQEFECRAGNGAGREGRTVPTTTATIERVLLLTCMYEPSLDDALRVLRAHQAAHRLLPLSTYSSIVREFHVKFASNMAMNASGITKSLKVLYERRALFEAIEDHAPALRSTDCCSSLACDVEVDGLQWCVSLAPHTSFGVSALLFAHHIHERFTVVRDKAGKVAAEDAARSALRLASDPLLFVLHALLAFPKLDISFRVQAKFAKMLFSLVPSDAVPAAHHRSECFAHLDDMSMYLMQELNSVFDLVAADIVRVATYCARTVVLDHHPEKTLNFVLTRPAFFEPAIADLLVPAFAELYAQGVALVLRYIRASLAYDAVAKTVPLAFTRLVEGFADEYPSADLRPLIKEFQLHDEFAHVVAAHDAALSTRPIQRRADPNVSYWALPLARDRVVFVDSDAAVDAAHRVLLASRVVAWDVEWRPDHMSIHAKSKCSIIQLACDTHVFVCDVFTHCTDAMQAMLEAIVTATVPWKVGFGLHGDIDRLRYSFPDMLCFDSLDEWENVLDLQSYLKSATKKHVVGLSRSCQDILGCPLDKSQQTSDWEARPLTEEQVLYAAADAYCLLDLVRAVDPPQMRAL
ncbi:hypothetical protein, variant 1 [Aphanomyces invadans]|uniref:3'-5' exonuclease domain-containing protein n=3 Tax=Aphanomyces invadans TaxID=157072 RepID=A0A024UX01_9STRA|nr:hypothetical protein, variant 1 [Aphanomyces invadans]ETW10457.1 hypothetical protein, variant 1 [Aphanomyces invadans]|eukprot:XP_008861870.1 hypothetical protein, variant 1 [Aphanomyces invadans]